LKEYKLKRLNLTDGEVDAIPEIPHALRALADWHAMKEVEAEASDFLESADYHHRRKTELREMAAYVEAAHEDGEYPKFED
jgi:predicted RNA-binding protein Jag